MDAIPGYIVTTSLEETWPKGGRILFLGDWCLRYSRRQAWSKLDYQVLPYHWDNRAKFTSDAQFIVNICDEVLPYLADALNELHSTDYSIRYWRILVGWWLLFFAEILFDRWTLLQHAALAAPGATLLRLEADEQFPASNDMSAFISEVQDDAWNERLMADIAEFHLSIAVQGVKRKSRSESNPLGTQQSRVSFFPNRTSQRILSRIGRSAAKVLKGVRKERLSLHSDYLTRLAKWRFLLYLRALPGFQRQGGTPTLICQQRWRNWSVATHQSEAFEALLTNLIPKYLPRVYLEGYQIMAHNALTTGFPEDAQVALTAIAFSSDEAWKFWAANQAERGCRIVVTQHGGHYGTAAFSTTYHHEVAICDRYLSWGWTDSEKPQVYAAPATKLIGRRKRRYSSGKTCVQVLAGFSRQSSWLFSGPVGPQAKQYYQDQIDFARHLDPHIQQKLRVRLDRHDYGWDLVDRWRGSLPNIELDTGGASIGPRIRSARIVIGTTNTTVFLETFAQGIPTVLFWNPTLWEESVIATPYFRNLRELGILFDDPLSCAKHVNRIWHDVGAWWYQQSIQAAVSAFASQFAYVGTKPFRELKQALEIR